MPQSDTVAFLTSGSAFPGGGPVELIETHGAFVFLAGDTALKLKRAVTYDYMDLDTLARRKAMIARELELNQPSAPQIYRDMVPVTQGASGLALDGEGEIVDWVLRMWRFPAECELTRIVARGALDEDLACAIGTAIAAYHAEAPIIGRPGHTLIADILSELGRVFVGFSGATGTRDVAKWMELAKAQLTNLSPILDKRGAEGHVRRAHGDLHLRKIVVLGGHPVLFDALEFDETLGTCDVLYDIAFLVMDLCHRGLRRQACGVLDAWLRAARGAEDAGLAALPLFLSVCAAIRAMVLLQTDVAKGSPGGSAVEVAAYLSFACTVLDPVPPGLVAVGGYSGSGKSLLARKLAPTCGALPGAALLSSDLERKAGQKTDVHLPAAAYSASQREAVYRNIFSRAAHLLAAGHSVLLDATFIDPDLRTSAEIVARKAGVPFLGLWLDAPAQVLEARVRRRKGDASDADAEVLRQQLAADRGELTWHRLDAATPPKSILSAARRLTNARVGR